MNIINQTAKANIRQNKGRNVLIGIAIMLTAVLLTSVPVVGLGAYAPRMAAANKIYPTFHAMYRGVSAKNAEEMKQDKTFEKVGLRQDPGALVSEKTTILLQFYDDTTAKLSRFKLKEGTMPKAENDIVVSKGLMETMGVEGTVGDTVKLPYQTEEAGGLSLLKEKEFHITGMIKDAEKSGTDSDQFYSALVSEAFVEQNIPEASRQYRVYFRVSNAEKMTTDQIEELAQELGLKYGVVEDDIVKNGEYLIANYVDPAVYTGIGVIMAIIILAGIMTIYSIYYVSMQNKIQEYGKMRALGATKKQIKRIVFREGFGVACIAVPFGLALGAGVGYAIVRMLLVDPAPSDVLGKAMEEVIKNNEVTLVPLWVIATAAVTTLLTVYFSLLKPMKIASRISPVEAIRCHSTQKEKRTKRKGYKEINVRKLTASNLSRNKKRTVVTIITLGITGVLFMTVATILSCMNAKNMAAENIYSDYAVSIRSESGNKMHPERELCQIQKENPLSEEVQEQIRSIPGVAKVETMLQASTTFPKYKEDDGTELQISIAGIDEANLEKAAKTVKQGSLDWEKLRDGTGIIVTSRFLDAFEILKPGDKVELNIKDGDQVEKRTFEIVAITDPIRSLVGGCTFALPKEVLQNICDTNLVSTLNVTTDSTADAKTTDQIKQITESIPNLEYDSMENQLSIANQVIGITNKMAYGFMAVLGIVGILNLINTMMNSVYVRKQELGMLQAIGLSDKQMVHMLQLEGLFYTAGTLALGLGVGNLCGYMCFLWAKNEGMMDIKTYHYPLIPTLIMAGTILAVQLLLTYLVNKNFKKQSLIERIRFSE